MGDDLPAVESDPAAGVYRTEIDPSETRPAVAIVSLFRALDDREDGDVPPLYDLVDLDALNALFGSRHGKELAEPLTLEITAVQFRLVISYSDGTADIRLRTGSTPKGPHDIP